MLYCAQTTLPNCTYCTPSKTCMRPSEKSSYLNHMVHQRSRNYLMRNYASKCAKSRFSHKQDAPRQRIFSLKVTVVIQKCKETENSTHHFVDLSSTKAIWHKQLMKSGLLINGKNVNPLDIFRPFSLLSETRFRNQLSQVQRWQLNKVPDMSLPYWQCKRRD